MRRDLIGQEEWYARRKVNFKKSNTVFLTVKVYGMRGG